MQWQSRLYATGDEASDTAGSKPRQESSLVFLQEGMFDGDLVIRANSNVSALSVPAMRIVRRIAPTALVRNVSTVAQIKDQSVAPRRLNAALISSFGIRALVIAAIGIAGVLAFAVSARTNEIGIRMSL